MRYPLLALLLLSSFSFAWWDSSFIYRSAINISNPGSALTDYQVQVAPSIYNNTGLVGSWHFSEGSGSLAADSSGKSNTGTITIGASGAQATVAQAWANGVSGKFGRALSFDGTDDFISVSSITPMPTSASLSFWAYSSNWADGVFRFIFDTNNGVGDQRVLIRKQPDNTLFFYIVRGGGDADVSISSAALSGSGWKHIVATYTAGSAKLYVNSAEVGSDTAFVMPNFASYSANIGAAVGGSYPFNGIIDEFRIYNRSLSAQEISELYNATKARLDYADLRFTQPYTVYETPISLSGAASNLTDYQVLVTITNSTILSHMRSDGADLRFFPAATSAPYSSSGLSYWIESMNSSLAKVWVKADVSSGGSTVYMYYGNVSAQAQSNSSATFLFFDDFNDLNYNGWTVSSGGWSASQGYLRADSTGGHDISVPSGTAYGVWEWRFRSSGAGNSEMFFKILSAGSGIANSQYAQRVNPVSGVYFDIRKDVGGVVTVVDGSWVPDTGWHDIRVTRDASGSFTLFLDGVSKGAGTDNSIASTTMMGIYTEGVNNYDFDDIRVRKYSATEPSATFGAESIQSSGNEASLAYWLESDKSAWVKVHSIPASANTVYSYYGSPSASSVSNGSATFDGFDRFDTDTWTDTGSLMYVDATNQRLYAKADRSATAHRSAKQVASLTDFNLTFDLNIINYNGNSGTLHIGIGDANANLPSDFLGIAIYQWLGQPLAYAYKREGGAQDSRTETGMGSSYPRNGKVVLWRNGATVYASYAVGATVAEYTWTGTSLGNLNYFMAYNNNDGAVPASWVEGNSDNWMLRKYVSPEPSASGGVEQQSDVAPPGILVSSPAGAAYSSISIPLNFTATDSSGVSQCKYELNGVNTTLAGCQNATINASSGPNSLVVWAFDGSNWGSASVSFNVSLDTEPPSIYISSPANVSYPSAPVPVIFTVSDAAAYFCVVRLNGVINYSSCANSSLGLGNGVYTLNVTANDTFGNVNSSAVSFTVDLTISVSNSTTTDSNGIGNVSLNGIPPGASRIVYSVSSSSFSRSFSVSSGVSSVRIFARATLQGTSVSGKSMAFAVS